MSVAESNQFRVRTIDTELFEALEPKDITYEGGILSHRSNPHQVIMDRISIEWLIDRMKAYLNMP